MAKMKMKNGATADFQLVDNGDDTLAVQGTDSAGNNVDISALGTIAWASADPNSVTVDPADGPSTTMHAVGPTATGVSITATFTPSDGSAPLVGELLVDVVTGGATGLKIVPGTPTTH